MVSFRGDFSYWQSHCECDLNSTRSDYGDSLLTPKYYSPTVRLYLMQHQGHTIPYPRLCIRFTLVGFLI